MKSSVFVRNPYNYSMEDVSTETGLCCEDVSLTKQQFADECDINEIVRRFNLTGQLPENVNVSQYADFESVYDFHSAMNLVREAGEAFMQFPADVRARFNHDPGVFVDFASNPDNYDEAVKLGLAIPRAVVDNVAAANPAVNDKGDSNGNS